MGNILITFIKQSQAYKLVRVAQRSGINMSVVQIPQKISNGGCSYGVKLKRADMYGALQICRTHAIACQRVFGEYIDVSGKKYFEEIKKT